MREIYKSLASSDADKKNIILTLFEEGRVLAAGHLSDGKVVSMLGDKALIADNIDEINEKIARGMNGCDCFELNGYTCFFRSYADSPELVICGGGHVASALVKLAKLLQLTVTVIEDRREFADNIKKLGADRVICKSFSEGLDAVDDQLRAYYIVLTRGHRYDIECLCRIYRKSRAYVGMMGSRKRSELVKKALLDEGIPIEYAEAVYMPVGLDIKAETPEEIAVSIMAEIISCKNQKQKNVGITEQMMNSIAGHNEGELCMATIMSKKGSTPRAVGACMLIARDEIIGTIGGGSGERRVIDEAQSLLEEGRQTEVCDRVIEVSMDSEEAAREGMVCGGSARVLLEVI